MKINKYLLMFLALNTQIALCIPPPVSGTKLTNKQLELHRQMLHAITEHNIDAVQELLARGANVNAIEKMGGVTLLVHAIECGNEKLCKLLISAGADVNGHVRFQTTPLMEAVRLGKTPIVKLLLEHGARLDNACRDMLLCAASNGYISVCKLLLATNFYDADDRSTALIYAASKGQIRCCKLLLAHGANRNFRGTLKNNWEDFLGERIQTTALRAAARHGHFITWMALIISA